MHDHVTVRVPATSANLGPGFDTAGLALGLWDTVEVRAVSGPTRVVVAGQGAGRLPTGEDHLVVQALRAGLEAAGAPQVGFELRCDNRIPHRRGLGSSAAAVVAGLSAARGLLADPRALDDDRLLGLATAFEGHPDNAAPAILGGASVAWTAEGVPHAVRLEVDERIVPVILVPRAELATARARQVLPEKVAHTDAVFNVGRAALLVAALTSRPEHLFPATEDRLHQAWRAGVMPETLGVVRSLRERGLAAMISGAGPSVLVLTDAGRAVERPAEGWSVLHPGVATRGAHVV